VEFATEAWAVGKRNTIAYFLTDKADWTWRCTFTFRSALFWNFTQRTLV